MKITNHSWSIRDMADEPTSESGPIDEGTALWRNWRSYQVGAVSERVEYAIYSDSGISGQLMDDSWPISVLPTHTEQVPGHVTRAAVLRIVDSAPLSERADEPAGTGTVDTGYHGGGSDDEATSLISLALGIRFRSGGMIRLWSESGGDPLGLPLETFHREPVWIAPGRRGSLLRDLYPTW